MPACRVDASREIITGIEGQVRGVTDREFVWPAQVLSVPLNTLLPSLPVRCRAGTILKQAYASWSGMVKIFVDIF